MHKLITRSAVATLLAVAGIGAAHADGLYVGGNLGTPDYRSNVNGISGQGSGIGGKLFVGTQLTPEIAVEGGLFQLGHSHDQSGRINVGGVFVDGVGTYGFAPQWSALGRLGVAEGRFVTTAGKDSSPALKLGAGLQYAISPQLALRGEYEHYHFTNAFSDKANVGEYSVGVKLNF